MQKKWQKMQALRGGSLRQAEVGIAVSNATDIAKGAASVVLTHEGLAEIVELIVNDVVKVNLLKRF